VIVDIVETGKTTLSALAAIIGFILFLIFFCTIFLMIALSFDSPDKILGHHRYEVTIRSDSSISNLTLYLPLPMINKTPGLTHQLSGGSFIRSLRINGKGPGSDINISTIRVDGFEYLTLSLFSVDPHRYYDLSSYELKISPPPDCPVDTRNPLAHEATFSPRFNLSSSTPKAPLNYDTTLFIEFSSVNQTTVTITSRIEGMNEWIAYPLGPWHSNSYRDSFSTVVTGNSSKWIPVDGELSAGKGNYMVC
jgi:hypothetical protein